MSSDLDWLKLKNYFTVYEAAYGILGITQRDKGTDFKRDSIVEELKISIDKEELRLANQVTKYIMCMKHGRAALYGEYITTTKPDGTDWHKSTIAREDLAAWCDKRNYRPAFLFPDGVEAEKTVFLTINIPATESKDHPLPRLEDDLANYHTPALDALRAAISHFWLNHNPNHHPKREDIVKWLMEQHGMTQAMASSIDRIIRPEGRRKGGNSKRN
jgi:hypothetical protein